MIVEDDKEIMRVAMMIFIFSVWFSRTPCLAGGTALPQMDVLYGCKSDVEKLTGAERDRRYKKCVDDNQINYDWLKARWSSIPEDMKICISLAGGRISEFYGNLRSCLEQEEAKAREKKPELPQKEFRY